MCNDCFKKIKAPKTLSNTIIESHLHLNILIHSVGDITWKWLGHSNNNIDHAAVLYNGSTVFIDKWSCDNNGDDGYDTVWLNCNQ